MFHFHLFAGAFESNAGVQLFLQFVFNVWWCTIQKIVLQCATYFCQIGLCDLRSAAVLSKITGSEAVTSVHTVTVLFAPPFTHHFLKSSFRNNTPCVYHLYIVTLCITKPRGTYVAHEETSECAVEEVLNELKQTDGYLSLARPGWGGPLVDAPSQAGWNPQLHHPWKADAIEWYVRHLLHHIQVPTEAQQSGSVLSLLQHDGQQEFIQLQ